MEPIINPSLFYWTEVFDAIYQIGFFILWVGIVGIIIIGILLAIEFEYQDKPVINFYFQEVITIFMKNRI